MLVFVVKCCKMLKCVAYCVKLLYNIENEHQRLVLISFKGENYMDRELSILLIEDDTQVCKRFAVHADVMDDISIVAVTNNVYRALELVRDNTPDTIVLNLELNEGKGNGLQFLQDLNEIELSFKPYILVTTNVSSTVTTDYVREYGVDFIMSKHQSDYSEKNALEFLKMMKDIIQDSIKNTYEDYGLFESKESGEKRLKCIIDNELNSVGISPKAIGYKYLEDAITLIINGEERSVCIVIGETYGKSNSSVERAMQNAIDKAWRIADPDELFDNYKARIDSRRGIPTLTEFVYYYAKKIKEQSLSN